MPKRPSFIAGSSILVITALVSACGGGGGGVAAQIPTVTASLSSNVAQIGESVRLTWSSTNATECGGSGVLPATMATSGGAEISVTAWGKLSYTVTCNGNGGSASKSVSLTVPAPLYGSSYENKTKLELATTNMPGLWDPSMVNVRTPASTAEIWSPRALAIADFYQEGQYSMLVAAGKYADAFPGNNPQKWADSPGHVYFLRKGQDGNWIDDSAKLFKSDSDRLACIGNSYAIVADFNGDKRPDVYLACTGIDFTLNGVWTDAQNSEQIVFLSQSDGTYKRRVVSEAGVVYSHQATAADIDGDGTVDVVTVDPVVGQRPFVLWGNGDGTFRKDTTRMPDETFNKNIYGAILMPIDGNLRLVLSGFDEAALRNPCYGNCYGTKIFKYEGGKFVVETDLTPIIPNAADGYKFGLGLDHIYWNGALYSFHVNDDYTEDGVVRFDLRALTSSVVYRKSVTAFGDGLILINITKDGYLGNYGAICNQSDATFTGTCAVKVKL